MSYRNNFLKNFSETFLKLIFVALLTSSISLNANIANNRAVNTDSSINNSKSNEDDEGAKKQDDTSKEKKNDNPKNDKDCPCRTTGVGSFFARINFGANLHNEEIPEGYLFIDEEISSSLITSPQGLQFSHNLNSYILKDATSGLSLPYVREVTIYRPYGKTITYRFTEEDPIGKPSGDQISLLSKLVMKDANGNIVNEDPVYYDRVFSNGSITRFSVEGKNAVKIIDTKGKSTAFSDKDIGIEIIKDTDGIIRQIKAQADGLADVIVTDNFQYQVKLYSPDKIGAKDIDGLYTVSGDPHTVWTIENPERDEENFDHIRVTETVNGADYAQDWYYSESIQDWRVVTADGRQASKSKAFDAARVNLYQIYEVKDASNKMAYKSLEHIKYFPWGGTNTVEFAEDPDGANLKYTYTYYETSSQTGKYTNLKTKTMPDGSWESYDYDVTGRMSMKVESYLDAPEGSAAASAKATYYGYTPNESGDVLLENDARPRAVEVKILGQTVSKTYHSYLKAENDDVHIVEECVSMSAAYGDSSNLRMARTYYDSTATGAEAGRLKSESFPDGTLKTYTYEYGTYTQAPEPSACSFTVEEGDALRITVVNGTTASPDGIDGKSTKEITVRDQFGNNVQTEAYAKISGSWERVLWQVNTFDERHHITNTYTSNNTESSATWNCCGKASEKNENGTEYTYTYDLAKILVSKTKKGTETQTDIVTSYTYDGEYGITSETVSSDALSLVKSTEYDLKGRVTGRTSTDGLVTTYLYENGGRKVTETLPGGFTKITENYLDGRPKSVTGTALVAEHYTYGVELDGAQWTQVNYVSAGSPMYVKTWTGVLDRVVKTEKPGYTGTLLTQNYYNTLGQLAKTTTTGKADMLYSYDELGNLYRTCLDADANGTIDLASMDRINESETTFVTESSAVWQQTVNKVYWTSNADTATTASTKKTQLTGLASGENARSVETDINGNQIVSVLSIDRTNKTVAKTVDAPESSIDALTVTVNGLVASERSPSNLTYTYNYDALGRRTGIVDPRTGTSTVHYETNGRVDYVEDAAANRTSFSYEAETGRKASETNALSKAKTYSYNSRGQVLSVRGDADYPLDYVYDDYGRTLQLQTYRDSLTTPDTTTWAFQEATGLLLTKTYADGKSVSYTYTADGKMQTRTWSRPFSGNPLYSTYSYDTATGDLLTAIYSDNLTPNVTFTYNRLGQQLTVADAVGSRTFSYDSKFQLTGETINGIYNKTINRSYATTGVVGRYTGLNIGTEYALSFDYDTYGRAGSLTNGADTFTYGYLANSDLLSGITYPNTITVTNSYEATRDLLTSVDNKYGATTISKYDYVNNAISNRTSMAKSGTAFTQADTISYGYNDRSEVTSATAQNDLNYVYAYQFDNIGNRLTATEAGTFKAYTANQLNQYTAITNPAQDPTYDDDGNMLNDGTWTFTWDAENRMKSATNGTQTLEFTYDYLSRRVEKKIYSGVTLNTHKRFVYDNYLQIEELDALDSNNILKKRIWSGDKIISEIQGATAYYALGDANKNITEYLDASGAVKAHYEYSPFGKITVKTGDMQDSFDYRFSSEYFDTETGLVYYNYRYYSPDLGRWLSRDPIEEEGGWNLNAFLENDPINWIDSLGLDCPCKDGNWWDKLLCKANNLLAKLNGTDKDTNTRPAPPNTTALDAAMKRSLDSGKTTAGTGVNDTADTTAALANAAETAVDTAENIGWGITGGIAGKIAKTLKNIAKIFKGAKKTSKETGSYTNTHKSGMKYHGKGDKARSQVSGAKTAKENNDPHTATDYTPAENTRAAFKAEARRLRNDGGVESKTNYNKINSPGEKYLRQDGE